MVFSCRLSRAFAATLLLVSATTGRSASAQSSGEVPHSDRLWLTAGVGFGSTGGNRTSIAGGLAGGAGLSYQPSAILFTVRAGGVWSPFQGDVLGDAAFLIGAGTRGSRNHASLAVGPALTGGDLRAFQSSHRRFSSRLGLGIQTQVLALPLSSIGGGLIGFANLNHHQSFGGITFSLAFGQLR